VSDGVVHFKGPTAWRRDTDAAPDHAVQVVTVGMDRPAGKMLVLSYLIALAEDLGGLRVPRD
jgi:hypothetical protein